MLGLVTGPANALMFIYSESVLGLPRLATAAMVAAAGVFGLGGLLAGRWAADRVGRIRTAATTEAIIALAAILTYSGSAQAAVAGYLVAIFAASVFAPAMGALAADCSRRGFAPPSQAGWVWLASSARSVAWSYSVCW